MVVPRFGEKLNQQKEGTAHTRFPEIVVPGMGVSQVILKNWFRMTIRDMETVGDCFKPVIRVHYFRLLLPANTFWSYRAGVTNRVPSNAVIVYG